MVLWYGCILAEDGGWCAMMIIVNHPLRLDWLVWMMVMWVLVFVEDPIEMERLADALPVEQAASRWIVSTDPAEHIEHIRPYLDLGFTHLVFHAPGTDQERFLRLYGAEVLPRLRELAY